VTIDASLLADDLAARAAALDVTRSFIVQAPAGSGKTELLIQRYLKLLSVVANPEEVLAITFTRKAAAEMQFRVLRALQLAHRGEAPEQDHQRLTAQLAHGVLRRDRDHDWNLLANPRRMRIQTLDSLNASIARARPLSATENTVGMRIVVDAEMKSLHRHAALATLDWLTESGPMSEATRVVLQHVDNNTGLYVDYVAQMLATRDQWLPFIGSGLLTAAEAAELRRRFEENLESAVREHLQDVADMLRRQDAAGWAHLFGYAAGNIAAENADNPISRLAGLEELPPVSTESLPLWLGVAELLLTKSGSVRKQVNKVQGFPAGDSGQKETMKAVLQELAAMPQAAELLHGINSLPPSSYSDEQWHVLLALFRLLPLAVSELRRLFGEQGVADHIEVALAADGALGTAAEPGDIALLLDHQVRHLLVDEMQDTSSAQYRMLEALTRGWEPGDGRSLYCVGDPMQSIYRFRNAEVGQFLLAKRFGIGEVRLEPLVLRRNFRSGERLVEWFNEVFPAVLASEDDPFRGAIAYESAVSVPQQAGAGHCTVHPVFGGNIELEAAAGRRIIEATLDAHPDDKMAVLVRSRTQLPQLLAELRHARIPYSAIDIDRLTDLPEIIDVLALTRAAVHSGDRLAWLAVLRAPWIGLDWTDLHALVLHDLKSTVWELLADRDRLDKLSVHGRDAIERARPVLSRLVAPRVSSGLRDVVESCWLALGGPALLGDAFAVENVYRYFDVVEKHERYGSLDDVAELESLLDLERVSSGGDARLQIMTMHRAKGLEFDHVLLYGLGRTPGSGDRGVLSWFDVPDEHGEERKIISPVGPRADLERDPVHRFIELREAGKDRHEQARLLYVACTRARKGLHLLGHTALAADGESFRPAIKGSLLQMLWPAVERDYLRAFERYEAPPTDGGDRTWIVPPLCRVDPPWSLPVFDAPRGQKDASVPQPPADPVSFYWVGTAARIAGTIVHRWLQAMAEGRAPMDSAGNPLFGVVTRRWLHEMGIGDDQQPAIAGRVDAALRAVLDDARGRWILSGDGQSELGLSGLYEGQVASIVIDRVRIDDDGTRWIIDYKTSVHEGGDLAAFLQAEATRYSEQLRKYAGIYADWSGCAPRCALYFPLLGAFVEVDV